MLASDDLVASIALVCSTVVTSISIMNVGSMDFLSGYFAVVGSIVGYTYGKSQVKVALGKSIG